MAPRGRRRRLAADRVIIPRKGDRQGDMGWAFRVQDSEAEFGGTMLTRSVIGEARHKRTMFVGLAVAPRAR